MKIALIDNDLCMRKNHNFPNLALMKISSYHKNNGDDVSLININEFDNCLFPPNYDKVYLAKVFSDTNTPSYIENKGIIKGGSGFYYDKAEKLAHKIEHFFPDYGLYNQKVLDKFIASNRQKYFLDYSIGFTTRGCIRRCSFCINKNERVVYRHSDLNEFVDEKRPFIMLLDDNIIAYDKFEEVFEQLNKTGKPFVYKQGMDFRLMDERKLDIVFNSNYLSTSKYKSKGMRVFHFAFDNYKDKNIIEKNLILYHRTKKYGCRLTFYVLTGFDRTNKYDKDFWETDLFELLKRIELLFKYQATAYIMKHENYKLSPFKKHIENLTKLCNYPAYVEKKTIKEALSQSELYETIEFLNVKFSWFLNTKLESSCKKNFVII